MNRRNVLVGLGTIVAGGGAALGTGAFSTVTAERTVSVETAGDSDAFLALTAAEGAEDYVDTDGDTIEIDIGGDGDGINQDALTRFEELVEITNNGTNSVDISASIVESSDEADVLTLIEEFGEDNSLGGTESTTFGLAIELREAEVGSGTSYDEGDLTDDFDPTIEITAESTE
ncbi:hypothetical protein D8Y22_08350 [Salinadaptatus halalkaliphilus]|uniref:DUF1102 domain-containing protein n=1 Tax=Salinadaptatus halalkaliphilus TaxID=2419781 RepID=A0A4S3TLY5_9EURY|nr:hypothetical protein [Salinadaptatus halalkaliphilus]THE65214.1 hypothetical protein D8Y22_08350 [Salinadaptatus halalkaliphilus]